MKLNFIFQHAFTIWFIQVFFLVILGSLLRIIKKYIFLPFNKKKRENVRSYYHIKSLFLMKIKNFVWFFIIKLLFKYQKWISILFKILNAIIYLVVVAYCLLHKFKYLKIHINPKTWLILTWKKNRRNFNFYW